MYRILLCDDEGIVREGLKFMIHKSFGEKCMVEEAKSGRMAIEKAEEFRPDIIFMDIQMPGINGLESIREIQKIHKNIKFIVLTAYDKFNYAKDAIDLGVMEYLTKPISQDKAAVIIAKAMKEIDERRAKVSQELEIKEKLETVIPVIENGFIYSILLQEYDGSEIQEYQTLLGIREEMGYVMTVKYGDDVKDGALSNPVGAGVKIQKSSENMREIIKEFFPQSISAVMGNKSIVFVPQDGKMEYEERVQVIDRARAMVRKLEQRLEMKCIVGMGSTTQMVALNNSYKQSLIALKQRIGKVTHIEDIPAGCEYEEYPIDIENQIFDMLEKGNKPAMAEACSMFIDWLEGVESVPDNNVRLKAMEFVLRAEQSAYLHGGMTYRFDSRNGYMEELAACDDYSRLYTWFVGKMQEACNNIMVKQQEKSLGVVNQAKQYIKENYKKDLSLDDISKKMNISPYYFSKIFKEEEGVNFVEYLTGLRMDCAKKMLADKQYSIKEICSEVGYKDPNYFSRIFKKCVGTTPSEYREGGVYEK